jgi:hydroxymethylbilane synthase
VTLRLATRGSRLALWQAEEARRLLQAADPRLAVELVAIESHGDRERERDLAALGATGVFTAAVDAAVRERRADAAVHSLKDLPTALAEGLVLGGCLARGPVEDALVTRGGARLADLRRGARVATGSVRRAALLRRARPDLELAPLRGNVETRLAKLAAGEADAIVLARAGLDRLGLGRHVAEVLDPRRFVPAVGQAIVGLTCRAEDEATRKKLAAISDLEAVAEARAERALLAALRGGCNAPVGARARASESALSLHAVVLSLDGAQALEDTLHGGVDEPEALGARLAEALLERGAGALIEEARRGR